MQPALKISKIKGKNYSAVFAIKVKGIRVLPAEERRDYAGFIIRQLGRQMDVIHSLHEAPVNYTIDLRYLYHPKRPHRIDVYFLIKVIENGKQKAAESAMYFYDFFFNQLMVNNQHHEFEPVHDGDFLEYLIEPFEFNEFAEIVRREDNIPLDTARKLQVKPMGFHRPKTTSKATSSAEIYYVFPFSITLNNMERLCHTLYLQKNPILVSICLRPFKVSEKEENLFQDRLNQCEKYSQLSIGNEKFDDIDQVIPYLQNQAAKLYQRCSQNLSQFLDAAFLQKIQITSSAPLPHGVISVTGATLTEHTGHPKLIFSEKDENEYAGGYEYFYPANEKEHSKALNNLKNMEFDHWVPTIADKAHQNWRYLFNVSQAIAGFRLPISTPKSFPGIDTWQFQIKPAPSDLPAQGLFIGENTLFNKQQNVYLKTDDRRRHNYIVGQTGTGKSTLLQSMILQDIHNGEGVGLIDPHGELIEKILSNIPESRKHDVVYLNPVDLEFPIGINLLDGKTSLEKDFCVNYLIEIFDQLYDLKETGGPMFEMYMRNVLQLLLEQPEDYFPTVLDVPRFFQNKKFKTTLLDRCTNPFVKSFWENEADNVSGDAQVSNIAPYITSKLNMFLYNNLVKAVVGQQKSGIDFRDIMDSKKIFLVDLRKGLLGKTNSAFIGMLVVGKMFTAALSRTNIKDKSALPDFYLYVDEFQNLATERFADILSEARKYKLCLTLANQYASQINPRIIFGIFGNIGTLVSFRAGLTDAKMISEEFGEQVSPSDLMGLSNFTAYIRLLIDGARYSPFNIRTILPETKEDPKLVEHICQWSRKKYGKPIKEVDEEIYKAWGIGE